MGSRGTRLSSKVATTMKVSMIRFLIAFAGLLTFSRPANAELTLSQLVVDLSTEGRRNADIEIFNDATDKVYLLIEPSEIVGAGTPAEQRRAAIDPVASGILVTPTRTVLEPGQRKRLRIAATGSPASERVYRVLVRPVTGEISGAASGLKLLVGYDVLALVRPSQRRVEVQGTRRDGTLEITNHGNVSVELSEGKQCGSGQKCTTLAGKRLYPGASWSQRLGSNAPVTYRISSPAGITTDTF